MSQGAPSSLTWWGIRSSAWSALVFSSRLPPNCSLLAPCPQHQAPACCFPHIHKLALILEPGLPFRCTHLPTVKIQFGCNLLHEGCVGLLPTPTHRLDEVLLLVVSLLPRNVCHAYSRLELPCVYATVALARSWVISCWGLSLLSSPWLPTQAWNTLEECF